MNKRPEPQDELACAQLMSRASYYADLHQIDAFVGLFADNAWVERAGERFKGLPAIRAFMESRKRERVTRHLLTPTVVEFSSADEASGVSFFTLYDAIAAEGHGVLPIALPATVGEFRQTYRQIGGEWKINSHASSATFRRT